MSYFGFRTIASALAPPYEWTASLQQLEQIGNSTVPYSFMPTLFHRARNKNALAIWKDFIMTYQRPHATLLAIAVCLLSGMPVLAQSRNPEETANPTGYEVTQITGLHDAGQLTLSDTDLQFTNVEYKAEIPFTRMTSVSIGNERIETGGKTGRVARTVIPFGGGMALATVTQKSVDLLTIEYLDLKGGYHGVVFFVPKSSAGN
jgi:hypothetical protein